MQEPRDDLSTWLRSQCLILEELLVRWGLDFAEPQTALQLARVGTTDKPLVNIWSCVYSWS